MHCGNLLRCASLSTAALILLASCATPAAPESATITGTATYHERMALPPGAQLQVSLEDVSRADAEARTIAQTQLATTQGPPYKFSISYPATRIVRGHRYALRARITSAGRLLFIAEHHPVLGDENISHVDLVLRRADAQARADNPPSPRMRGTYTYMADAGWFTDCLSARRLAVAQEGDNAALERAYARTRSSSDSPVLATVHGRVENRVNMEGPERPTLIVERFVSLEPQGCSAPGSTAQLENTYWKLTMLEGETVTAPDESRVVHFVLQSENNRVVGFAGCNRMMGSYTLNGPKLTFSQMGGTMMACSSGMEIEKRFHAVFPQVTGWRISGETLQLLDASETTLAAFESRYLQ